MTMDSDWVLFLPFNLPSTTDPIVSAGESYGIPLPLPFNLPSIPVASRMAFTTEPAGAGATQTLVQQPVITLLDAFGTPTPTSTATVTISIKPGTGTPGAVLSGAQPVASVAGVVSFPNLSIDLMGANYVLVATAPGLPAIESDPFTVGPRRLLLDFVPGLTPDLAAPLATSHAPLVGSNGTITDSAPSGGKAFQIRQGRLRVAQLGSAYTQNVYGWGHTAWTGPAIARVQGRAFAQLVNIEDPFSSFACHWATSATVADPRSSGTGGSGVVIEAYGLEALINSKLTGISTAGNNIRPSQYMFMVVLQSTGCYVFVSTFGNDAGKSGNMDDPIGIPQFPAMRLAFAGGVETAAILFPSLHFSGQFNYDYGHAVEQVQVFDITSSINWTTFNGLAVCWDSFSDTNGTSITAHPLGSGGAWVAEAGSGTIQSNTLQLAASSRIRTTGAADCTIQDTMQFSAASGQENRIKFRIIDASNYNYLRCVQGATFVLGTVVAGTDTILRQGGPNLFTKGAGGSYDIAIAMEGGYYQIWLDNVKYTGSWIHDTGNANLTGTGIALDSTSQGGGTVSHSHFTVFPHTVTAPLEVQLCGAAPTILTPGVILVQDDLNLGAGVHLNTHTPAIGPAWIEDQGAWLGTGTGLVQAAVSSSDTLPALAIQDVGETDVAYNIDITMNAVFGSWIFGGIIGRWSDDNNFFVIREADAVLLQPNDQEIELNMFVGAFSHVVHKTQFGIPYTVNSTHTLTCYFKGDMLFIFLDGLPRESFVLPPELCTTASTRFGPYHIYPDDSVRGFKNVLVKSLADPGVSGTPGSMTFTDLDPGGVSGSPSSMTFTD